MEGTIINSDFLNGFRREDAKQRIIKEGTKEYLKKKINLEIKGWGISRQRFWGCQFQSYIEKIVK